MRTLPLAVLALAVLTLAPVHAQPAPAPAPVANDPQAVAKQFLLLLQGIFDHLDDAQKAIEPLVAPDKAADGENDPVGGAILLPVFGILSLIGAQPVAGETAPDGRMTIPVQAPPLRLVMVQVAGKWKVDMDATFAGLPVALRKAAKAAAAADAANDGAAPAPAPPVPGAGGPAPPG